MEQELLTVMRGLGTVLTQMQQTLGEQVQQRAQGAPATSTDMQKGYVLDPRAYYSLKFEGKEEKWNEFYGKFTGTIAEQKPDIYELMKFAEGEEDPVTERDIIEANLGNPDDQGDINKVRSWSSALKTRLGSVLELDAWVLYNTVQDQNGFEAWRRIVRKYNPRTAVRGMQLMAKVTNPGRIKKGQNLATHIAKWETQVNHLERDYSEKVSERMRIGILISMVPEDLQEILLQQVDDSTEYRTARDRMIMLVDARAKLKDPNAMDVGMLSGADNEGGPWARQQWGCEAEGEQEDIDALAKVGMQCYNCHGYGHRVDVCPSQGGGKGPGGKQGQGKGGKGDVKGKGKGGKGDPKGKGKGFQVPCSVCGKMGHGPDRCWTKHPHLMYWKNPGATNSVEEWGSVALGSVEREERGARETDDGWTIAGKSKPAKKEMMAPTVKIANSFQTLEDELHDVGSLDVMEPEVNEMATSKAPAPSRKLRSAGRGKITVDSGAAESVLPTGMVPGEPLVEGSSKKAGVKYMAACGTSMPNRGEKRVKFRTADREGQCDNLSSIQFQVTDVNKPLAAVSKILDKGNSVLFTREGKGSCIINDVTGERIYLTEEKGVFVLDVEFFEPDADDSQAMGFPRQGS